MNKVSLWGEPSGPLSAPQALCPGSGSVQTAGGLQIPSGRPGFDNLSVAPAPKRNLFASSQLLQPHLCLLEMCKG